MKPHQHGKNPFLFVGGVPRSGTTLLQRMLNHHPQLAVTNDSHFIPRALEKTDSQLVTRALRGDEIFLTDELVKNVGDYHRFWRLGLTAEEFADAGSQSRSFPQLVSAIYDRVAQKSKKKFAGEKTPDYVRRFAILNALFPQAKLIHLLRDGRNVALSLLGWATPTKGPGRIELWNEQPIAICALWWRWMVMTCEYDCQLLDPDVSLLIRYENLVTAPESEIRKACDFLGMEFSQQMLQYHRGRSKPLPGLSAKSAWLAPQTGLRDWRTDMTDGQIQLFEALAGDALLRFGYEPKFSSIPWKTQEIARTCRQWWMTHFANDKTLNEPSKSFFPAVAMANERDSRLDSIKQSVLSDSDFKVLHDCFSVPVANQTFASADFVPRGSLGNAAVVDVVARRHKPGRRCLIEFRLEAANYRFDLLGKASAKRFKRTALRHQQALFDLHGFDANSEDSISVPPTRGMVRKWHMWFQDRIPLPTFGELGQHDCHPDVARRIAAAIWKLHHCQYDPGRDHRISDELKILTDRLRHYQQQKPAYQGRVEKIIQQCCQLCSTMDSAETVVLHRDFYHDQILLSEDRTWLVDLDLVAAGHPAIDLGNFLAHLTEDGLRQKGNPDYYEELEYEIAMEYCRLNLNCNFLEIQICKSLSLARLIFISHQIADRRPTTEAMIALVENRLGKIKGVRPR